MMHNRSGILCSYTYKLFHDYDQNASEMNLFEFVANEIKRKLRFGAMELDEMHIEESVCDGLQNAWLLIEGK